MVMSRFFIACWKWYDGVLVRRPVLSQSISTGVICSIGDVIAQEVIEKKGWKNYDFQRTLKFGAIGLFYVVCFGLYCIQEYCYFVLLRYTTCPVSVFTHVFLIGNIRVRVRVRVQYSFV